jgi:serine/threonine-protein kinase
VQTATADPLVGRTLEGRYRILSRIARGGMSTVYAAVDERLERHVAVKVMSAALSSDPAFTDRFAREARTAARLTHLNAVSVYDQGLDTSNGAHHVFLVMELVEGRTLRDLMREHGRFTPAEAVSIMEPVLSALSAAHRAGLVHRDVKPENILLSDDGIVKVADFGLARAVESDAESTRTGLMMGTVAYCPPEQITRGRADQRSDVYSAGVVLFELLTGKPPYQGDSAMNVAYQHVHSRVPAPSSRIKGIPSEIDELVVNATDSDPDSRPADAGEFLAEIAEVRAELALPVVPIPARPRAGGRGGVVGTTSRTTAPGERARGFESATTALPGRGPVRHDTRVVPGRGPAARHDPDGPPPPVVIPPKKPRSAVQRRRRRSVIVLLVVLLLGVGGGVGAWWFASGRYSTVPNVAGDTLDNARTALQGAGYKAGNVSSSFSETVPKDRVISSDPAVGARAVRGTSISLTVSLGQDRIAVPQVATLSPADAEAALQRGGVTKFTTQQRPDDTVHTGVVIGTDPPAGTKIKRTDAVTILVSTGPPILDVPKIAPGTPYADAEHALKVAGFGVARVDQFADSIAAGTVISLSPSDHQVKFGTVTVTVSKGPQFVTIPNIAPGTPFSQAKAQLEGLGLVVQQQKAFNLYNQFATMDPPAGTVVQVGSTVVVTTI